MHHLDKSVNLNQDFNPPTEEDWKEAANQLLKGAPFDKIMRTKTYEDIALEPIYTQERIQSIVHHHTLPGQSPFVRGTSAGGYITNPWKVAQLIKERDPESFNKALLDGLQNGQDTVNLEIGGENGVQIENLDDLDIAFDQVDLHKHAIMINPGEDGLYVLALLAALAKKRDVNLSHINGSILNDPLRDLVCKGKLNRTPEAAFDQQATCTNWISKSMPQMKAIGVDASIYQDAGASAVQELTWGLATGTEYLRQMINRHLSIETAANHMQFVFGLGSNFFMEIAKLRAARLLWSQIVEAFGGSADAQKMNMHTLTGKINKTWYDPYVNMLRTSTEAFAAIMGGANSLHISSFDEVINSPDSFSRRIARNTHTILREECHFDRVVDPAGGSWYIETLTAQIAQKSWKKFQDIEAAGGMITAILDGRIQQEAQATLKTREKNSFSRKDRIVGTNMYPNLQENPLNNKKMKSAYSKAPLYKGNNGTINQISAALEKSEDIIHTMVKYTESAGITLLKKAYESEDQQLPEVKPLTIKRPAEHFESLRKAVETFIQKTGQAPKVFLANIGPVAQYKARADFSTGFFQVAGFEIEYPGGFSSAKEAAQAALDSKAEVLVLCSTDATYPDLVPEFVKTVKQQAQDKICVLAGYPKEHIESFKNYGVDEFIHIKANVYEILAGLLHRLGVIQ